MPDEANGQRLTSYIAKTHAFRPMSELVPGSRLEYLLMEKGECYVCRWDEDIQTWREMEFYTIIEPEGWLPNLEPGVM